MSLNQKYTWKDFLKDNLDYKEKGIKRTSSEAEKAFNTAYKTKMKEYIAERQEIIVKMIDRADKKRLELTEKVKVFQKKKDWPKAKFYQEKVGKQDAAIVSWNNEKKLADQKKKSL